MDLSARFGLTSLFPGRTKSFTAISYRISHCSTALKCRKRTDDQSAEAHAIRNGGLPAPCGKTQFDGLRESRGVRRFPHPFHQRAAPRVFRDARRGSFARIIFPPAHHLAQLCAHLLQQMLTLYARVTKFRFTAASRRKFLHELHWRTCRSGSPSERFFISLRVSSVMRRFRSVIAVFRRVGDGIAHHGKTAAVDEVDVSFISWIHSKYPFQARSRPLPPACRPAFISSVTPPHSTHCSPNRSVSVSSRKVSRMPARPAPMPLA